MAASRPQHRCEAGHMARNISPEDLQKISELREARVTWNEIARALRQAGWTKVHADGLGRHFRGLCRCESTEDAAPVFSFTPVAPE